MLSSKNRNTIHLVKLIGVMANPFVRKKVVLEYLSRIGRFQSASLYWAIRKHRMPVQWEEEYEAYPELSRIKNHIQQYNQQRSLFWLRLKKEWIELTKVLQSHQIDFVWVKGFMIPECFYPQGEHRFFNDLDLLIHPRHLNATTALLHEHGYAGPGKISGAPKHYRKSISFRKPDVGVELELHFSLLGFFYDQWTLDTIRPNLVEINLSDGLHVSTLNDEHHLIYMAKHGSVHRWHRLFWLRDVIMVLQKKDSQLVFLAYEKMKPDHAQRCLLLMLALCKEIYQIPVDPYQSLLEPNKKVVNRLVKYCLSAMQQGNILSAVLKWQKMIYYWYLFPNYRLRLKILSHILLRKFGF